MDPVNLLAVAAVITAVAALVTAFGGLVKLLSELRQVAQVQAATHAEVAAVKTLVNGNHTDLVHRLSAVTMQRDEARTELRERDDRGPG